MNEQWQDNLRDRMERHKEAAPEGLWNDIEQAVSTDGTYKALSTKRNIPLWSLRIGAVAAVALILFYIGLHTLKLNENSKDIQTVEQVQKEYVVSDMLPSQQEPVAKIEEQLLAHRSEKRKPESGKVSQPTLTNTITPISETGKDFQINEKQVENKINTLNKTQKQQSIDNSLQPPDIGTNNTPAFQLPENRHHRRPPKWQTGVYASNIPSTTTKKHDGYGSFNPYNFPSEEEEYVVAAVRSDLPENTSILNEYQHVYTDVEHHQPITLGLSMKYNINERWSITSGLTYTILSSWLYSGGGNHYYNSRQTLHYVGIPLNVNYTVWKNDKISTYVTGGGLVEKNVSGTLSTDFVIDNKLGTQSSQKIFVKPLQWSVNSAAGIQYQLAKNIGIYAEPGVAYYFKNKSDVETIYKEKPLNFNIRFGLRFSLNE